MVTPISGFQASDGKIFPTEAEAYMQELRNALLQITGGNLGITDTIIANRTTLYPPLKALIKKEGDTDGQD
jgi:hypothetical protein